MIMLFKSDKIISEHRTYLQLPDADVINGSSAKLAEKLFSAKVPQVINDKGPQVKDIVAGNSVPFLHNHNLGT
jgi:hypothetical protein